MDFSSRMKDYYDIYYLANKFEFDGNTLCEALSKTFENRNRTFSAEQFEHIMTFAADDGMQKKWIAFIRKINSNTDDFKTVLKMIKLFLSEPFTAVISNPEFTKHWSDSDGKWK